VSPPILRAHGWEKSLRLGATWDFTYLPFFLHIVSLNPMLTDGLKRPCIPRFCFTLLFTSGIPPPFTVPTECVPFFQLCALFLHINSVLRFLASFASKTPAPAHQLTLQEIGVLWLVASGGAAHVNLSIPSLILSLRIMAFFYLSLWYFLVEVENP